MIDVEIDSELKEIPDFIFSAVGTRVKAGMYRPTGAPLPTSGVEEPLVNIRPLKPFGIDKKSFGKNRSRKYLFIHTKHCLAKNCLCRNVCFRSCFEQLGLDPDHI